MFRRQFIITGIASSVLASTKLYGSAHTKRQAPCRQHRRQRHAASANASVPPDWVNPFPPHRVMGNLYYVGSEGLASYLVTTPDGNILINSSLEQSVPLIQASIEKLGFKFSDTKILLISHAHWDHCAGSAKINANDRREIHGDGRRRSRRRVRRQKRFSLRQRARALVSANESRSRPARRRRSETRQRRPRRPQNRRPHQRLHHLDHESDATTKAENSTTPSSSAAPTSTPATNS